MQDNSDAAYQEMLHSHVMQNTTDASVPLVQVMEFSI
jgi:hypothetical protein